MERWRGYVCGILTGALTLSAVDLMGGRVWVSAIVLVAVTPFSIYVAKRFN